MNKQVSAYLDEVCAHIKSRQARLSARSELSGHIRMRIEELTAAGLAEEEAVKEALARMGDPHDIGGQIAAFNAPWQNILTVVTGIVLFAAIFFWLAVFRGVYLFDLSALTLVLLLTLAFVLIGGLSRLTWASAFVRGRSAALYAGGIGVVIGVVSILYNLADLSQMGPGLSFCLTSLLYGLVVSAVLTGLANFCRPLEGPEIRKILEWEEYRP